MFIRIYVGRDFIRALDNNRNDVLGLRPDNRDAHKILGRGGELHGIAGH